MFQKIKNAVLKKGKRAIAGIMAVAACASILSVGAFAAESTESGSNLSTIIDTAGTTLQAEFMSMVNSLVPVLISIAMVGLGMFAIVFLFKTAKNLFAKAAA